MTNIPPRSGKVSLVRKAIGLGAHPSPPEGSTGGDGSRPSAPDSDTRVRRSIRPRRTRRVRPVSASRPRTTTTATAAKTGRSSSASRRRSARRSELPAVEPGPPPLLFLSLFGVVVVLVLFGLVMVLSSSSVVSLRETGSIWSYFGKQFIWAGLGGFAMTVVMQVDYHAWRRWTLPALAASAGLLVVLLLPIPGIRVTVNGATRWLGTKSFSFQPSELAKLAIVLFVADLLARRMSRMDQLRPTMVPVLVVTTVLALLILAEPDLGTAIILGSIALVMVWVAGTRLGPLSGVLALASGAAVYFALSADYRRQRVLGAWDPWDDPTNTDLQPLMSLVGIANGGATGSGLGTSRQKWQYLPEAHNDFIFAIVAEETGFLGAIAVVGLFVALGVFGVQTALRAPDAYGTLIAAGVTVWILLQAVINLATVVGLVPITGVTLPFMSAGGSSLVVMMAATGMLLSVARSTNRDNPDELSVENLVLDFTDAEGSADGGDPSTNNGGGLVGAGVTE